MSTAPVVELGRLVTIVGGGTPSKARPEFFVGDVPWVTPKDMKVWTVVDSEDHISPAAIDASAAKLVPAGSVLVVIRSGVLKHTLPVAIAGRPVTLNQDMKALICDERTEPRYLAFFLKNAEPKLLATVRGTTADNIPIDELRALRIPLPPIGEQRRIAEILEKAQAIRRKRKEAIALTNDLLRSAFLEMFGDPMANTKGWPVKLLGELSDVSGGLQVTTARAGNPIAMPYLRVANVYRDRLDLSEVKEIRVTEAERVRATLQHGDVLVVEGHGNPAELGRAAVWRDEIAGCTHQNHLIRVRPNRTLMEPIFVSTCLNSSSGRQQMLSLGKTTSGLNTISTNNVRSVQIIVPPLQLQTAYAGIVERVRRLESRMEQRNKEDATLFSALVALAFGSSQEIPC